VHFEIDRGQVLSFVVQLECSWAGEWQAVVRYDTAHGFAHRDTMHPRGDTEKSEMLVSNYGEGLNYAIGDLKANWREYRRRYEEWTRQ
jgi:hypothetical protein